jgi:predicted nucleic acid-binding protein
MKRIYLDVCCLNRPFDDQSMDRIHLESEAVMLILKRLESGESTWISSTVIDYEVDQTRDSERKRRVKTLLSSAHQVVLLTEAIIRRSDEIKQLGFGSYDALHIASAEAGEADVVLTTDDKLVRLAMRHLRELRVFVSNPLQWLQEEMHHG